MPGWHARTKDRLAAGDVQVAGIIQEQHPDRCRLFMQWQRMDWPILVDALNRLRVSAVPLTFLIDEHGVIRAGPRARPEQLDRFLKTKYDPPAGLPAPRPVPDLDAIIARIEKKTEKTEPAARRWMTLGDALFVRGGRGDLTRSAHAYAKALDAGAPPDADFRRGVALRRRYESDGGARGDFQACIDAWRTALGRDPNQYIWRRRIQQYGPRLDKPYSFYDWVARARDEIRKRGETPAPLRVEPSGAEFAQGGRSRAEPVAAQEPDPTGRIRRDRAPLVHLTVAVVPGTGRGQRAARAHLVFTPNAAKKGHWNNEAAPLEVWLTPPDGVRVDRRRASAPNARAAASNEVRRVEFEIHYEKTAPIDGDGALTIPGYALYFACEDVNGQCLYLRRDFQVRVPAGRP